jgi:hypothetical protein
MMQQFIIDVSKKTDSDPQVTRQFRQIISYYRELAQQQIQNPKVKMLFDKVNESFQQLERGATNLVNIRKDVDGNTTDAVAAEDNDDSDLIFTAPVALSVNDIRDHENPTASPIVDIPFTGYSQPPVSGNSK